MLSSLASTDWDRNKAGILLQRAGFGGTPDEVSALANLSPAEAADFLLGSAKLLPPDPPAFLQEGGIVDSLKAERGKMSSLPDAAKADARKEFFKYLRATQGRQMTELRGWWLKQMAEPARAAREKLTLFLHGHFATSFEKVRSPFLLYQQNSLFREKGYGSWSDLVLGVAQDPAMLIYLDGAKSRAEAPNENFARELFELFTLGEGNYTEKDIQESARAFTGWGIGTVYAKGALQRGSVPSFKNQPKWHDAGSKTIFGATGNFDGTDVIRLTLAQAAAPRWITQKLWKFYAGWPAPEPLLAELVKEWQSLKGEIRPFLMAMWTNPNFYDPDRAADRVKSPTEWLVGLCRQIGRPLPAPAICANMVSQLGQNLFEPPNVKGWDGGIAWINTASITRRYEYGSWLVDGTQGLQKLSSLNMAKLAAESGLLKMSPPEITPEGMVASHGPQEMDPAEKRASMEKMKETMALPPAPVAGLVAAEERQSPEKLFEVLSARFLCGETISQDLRTRFQQAAGEKVPFTDAAVRKMILAMVQSPLYQVT
ncbi:MAG: DUF1800 domain-containing protein [Verrucomicrobia bacterium]|nr:DUF1800 domain-containing protein [Pseudomonadota bacterium]NBS07159.1 DUF1800 domain-containing protein [Verrucomicrobiota bacterium]NBS79799.1 DUF1800 domain-containing protein [bacterium]NBT24297.1 DUF1800 domain-containing protein [bacterium]NBV97356.1 DUF1800 domain-containing protein [Verrucomicrobiota bacterium]